MSRPKFIAEIIRRESDFNLMLRLAKRGAGAEPAWQMSIIAEKDDMIELIEEISKLRSFDVLRTFIPPDSNADSSTSVDK
jgi:hypothetical protein